MKQNVRRVNFPVLNFMNIYERTRYEIIKNMEWTDNKDQTGK